MSLHDFTHKYIDDIISFSSGSILSSIITIFSLDSHPFLVKIGMVVICGTLGGFCGLLGQEIYKYFGRVIYRIRLKKDRKKGL